MSRRILMLIICFILTATGCQNSPSASEAKALNQDGKTAVQQEQQYKVANDGGAFSGKDLIYFIMTDRFADGDEGSNKDVNKNDPRAYHGGDFQGIINKLDYIKSLGATAIWITPVTENTKDGYHGYWTNDFYKVDPHLGSMDDLKRLVSEAHMREMKVLIDHVVNHTSPDSKMLKDKPADWFHPRNKISNWNSQEELENHWLYDLPDLNVENPEVKDFLIENALWWIDQTGIDGMRLDTVRHVSKPFWNEFAKEIKEKYPDFYLLGEVWNDNSPGYIEQYHRLGIDGMTDYPLFKGIRAAFVQFGRSDTLVNFIEQREKYSNPEINGIFVDNHDNKRLVTYSGENGEEHLKQGLTFIMTYPSIPIIYYGTEIGMEGGDDPDNRRDMQWDKTTGSEMLAFYKKLAELRSSNAAISEGSMKLLSSDSYLLSYVREKDGKSAVVMMNLQNKEKPININIPSQASAYKDALTNKTYELKDAHLELTLKPLEILILESQ